LNIDNTKRRSYALCPRKFYYEHIKNLRPNYGSTALRYGLTWHSIIEEYYTVIKNQGWSAKTTAITSGILAGKKAWEAESAKFTFYSDYRTLENCLAAFVSYIDNYKDDENFMKIIDVETKFEIPLTPDLEFVGKIDGTVELNGTTWLMEQKTTGMPIDKQLKTLLRDPQIIGYFFAGQHFTNTHIEGVLIPMLHTSATKSKVTGQYGKPKIDFRRSPQIFTTDDILCWKESIIWTGQQIIESISKNHWPMQLDSCYHFGSCGYTALCEQGRVPLDEINTSNYITVPHWNVLDPA
jgi:hypothetical protein